MSNHAITPAELQAVVADAIRDMDGDAALNDVLTLGMQRPQDTATQCAVGRALDLQAAIRLADGTHSGTPLKDVADAAQRALSNPDAVAAWVCAPLTSDTYGA